VTNKQKEDALARIKDPKVREHYRAQFEMEEELEREGLRTGGIFDTHGVPSSGYVAGPIEEDRGREHDAELRGLFDTPPAPVAPSFGGRLLVAIVLLVSALAIFWSSTR